MASINEDSITSTLESLSKKKADLISQRNEITRIEGMLQGIKLRVVSTTQDSKTKETTNKTSNPIDPGTGNEMTDSRRLEIYNAAMAISKIILSE